MDISGCHFKYAGVLSRDYNLIFANVNTSRNNRMTGDISTSSIFVKNSKRKYFLKDDYATSPALFDAEIVTDNGKAIPQEYMRLIEKWLFYKQGYSRLYIDPEDDCDNDSHQFFGAEDKYYYYNCRFVNPERIEGNGGIAGYKFSVECDSCMLWQDPIVLTYNLKNSSTSSISKINVPIDTDIRDYTYPKITVKTGTAGGAIQLINTTHEPDRITGFVDLPSNYTLIMKSDGINYISGNNFSKFANKNFLRLLDGDNQISVKGNIKSIIFEFQNRRYL